MWTLIARAAPYEDVIAGLEQCLKQKPETERSVAHIRLTAALAYQRACDEVEAALKDHLRLRHDDPVGRAWSIASVCVDFPELMERYLTPALRELHALPATEEVSATIAAVQRVAERHSGV
ncbi:hypothetical protein [Haliangium sp.]|uniref:hypothetical protein n=1 Tax=Haliangium sp. TaxID=2663208 RepID=UPI003D0B5CB2